MRTSYSPEDVTVLLKDVTGLLEPLDTAARERRIQSGTHYSEMLPLEYSPSPRYLELYHEALAAHGGATARAVAAVAEQILAVKGGGVVLVSLARAGTPVGILIKRYLYLRYRLSVPHYTVSIVRDRGIDHNAMRHIMDRHRAADIQFVDGWIGKGAIIGELEQAMAAYPGVSPSLAVLADPARRTALYGSSQDFLIPSACLNATVSGLFSRTILNGDVIGPGDFHGAVYYPHLEAQDLSRHFLEEIQRRFPAGDTGPVQTHAGDAGRDLERIAGDFGVRSIHLIKPGIGETTRVLLRRLPWKILLRDPGDLEHTGHILRLCEERGVPWERYPLTAYRACGIIQDLGDV